MGFGFGGGGGSKGGPSLLGPFRPGGEPPGAWGGFFGGLGVFFLGLLRRVVLFLGGVGGEL